MIELTIEIIEAMHDRELKKALVEKYNIAKINGKPIEIEGTREQLEIALERKLEVA